MFVKVILKFKIENKTEKFRFFDEIFLFTKLSINIILRRLFLKQKYLKINILELVIFWKLNISKKAILTIKQVKLVSKKEFTIITLYLKEKFHITYIASFNMSYLYI